LEEKYVVKLINAWAFLNYWGTPGLPRKVYAYEAYISKLHVSIGSS